MRMPRGSFARAVVGSGLAVLLAAPALVAPPAALARPEVTGTIGSSFAILGSVEEGGAALKLNALWPLGGASSPMSLGLGLWAVDAGQKTQRLLDPGTGLDIGAVGGTSLTTFGGGLAADLHPGLGRAREASAALSGPYLSGAVGVFAVNTGQQGRASYSDGAPGWSAGGGWRFRLGNRFTVGPAVHYHRILFENHLVRFAAASVDWAWR